MSAVAFNTPMFWFPQLDLSQPLEEQGQLDVIIHKLTDLILEADQNDSQAMLLVQRVQVCICFLMIHVWYELYRRVGVGHLQLLKYVSHPSFCKHI